MKIMWKTFLEISLKQQINAYHRVHHLSTSHVCFIEIKKFKLHLIQTGFKIQFRELKSRVALCEILAACVNILLHDLVHIIISCVSEKHCMSKSRANCRTINSMAI